MGVTKVSLINHQLLPLCIPAYVDTTVIHPTLPKLRVSGKVIGSAIQRQTNGNMYIFIWSDLLIIVSYEKRRPVPVSH